MHEKPYKSVFQIFAVCLVKLIFANGGNGRFVTIILRFVGEKAREFLPERLFKTRVILFVRFLDEKIGDARIKNITIRVRKQSVYRMIFGNSRNGGFDAPEIIAAFNKNSKSRIVEIVFHFIPQKTRAVFLVF